MIYGATFGPLFRLLGPRVWGRAPMLVRRDPRTGLWGARCRWCTWYWCAYVNQPEALHSAHKHLEATGHVRR